MECEWCTSEEEIYRDFTKLLVAKAKHKLFVFNQRTVEDTKRVHPDPSRTGGLGWLG
jgi:hypothetical protein